MKQPFQLTSPFQPTGDQPDAIEKLVKGLDQKYRDQTLLGVTGSGKTFTMANVINRVQRPTLVISHNKTLAAQLAAEFQEYFPNNAVHYFVSYYDYYQPEAYMPTTDTYIEKETDINEEIDRLRHSATAALMTRRDVIIVASVSCIYGLGSPETYKSITITLSKGQRVKRNDILKKLVRLKFSRNDVDFHRGTFRVKGETLDVFPSVSSETALRLEFFGDVIERIVEFDPLTGETVSVQTDVMIFPATHYVSPPDKTEEVMRMIRGDLKLRLEELQRMNKLVEAQRLEQRVRFDLEMLANTGYCTGIENYSRYFDGRSAGEPSYTLIDYFPKDFLMFIDESHITLPQIRGMYFGDRARKDMLVEYGFRLPAAYDNRPLKSTEFEKKIGQVIYVSATPTDEELGRSKQVVEQLIRPTGLLDPVIDVRSTDKQIDNLIEEIRATVEKKERVLVTTLTKRMSEDLTDYLKEIGIKVQYLHSEVDTMERLEILRDLRLGKYDVLVGINLLREGLDLPEVSLVAILDADKEGYLRSATALIQTMGRAARHEHGRVVMYADRLTGSMKKAIDETSRRRKVQEAYNTKHKITPRGIKKEVRAGRLAGSKASPELPPEEALKALSSQRFDELVHELTEKMNLAARNLEFEEAGRLRDQIEELKRVKK